MLFLNPEHVTFDALPLPHVQSIAIDRRADRLVTEHDDLGPHTVFADVPEQRSTIQLRRLVTEDSPASPALAQQGALSFHVAPAAADAPARTIQATVVIIAVEHDLSNRNGAIEVIRAIAVAPAGDTSPIIETLHGGAV